MKNLEERIKIPALIEALKEVFSEYGNVIEIVAKRNLKAKGQAFVVFDNVDSAQNAIDEINGFELFGKQMSCDFAKTQSDATVARQGTEQDLEQHKRKRLAEKGMLRRDTVRSPRSLTIFAQTERKQAQEAAEAAKTQRPIPEPEDVRPQKATRGAGLKGAGGAAAGAIPDEYLPPNKTLFIRNIPEDYSSDALSVIFNRFAGFREVRSVPGRKNIAFVEYENEEGAISAKEATAGMTLGTSTIKVTYQRQ